MLLETTTSACIVAAWPDRVTTTLRAREGTELVTCRVSSDNSFNVHGTVDPSQD